MTARIAVIGERIDGARSQVFLNKALDDLQDVYGFQYEWVDTGLIEDKGAAFLKDYDGFWSAPGGQFKSTDGALSAIRYARENDIPHLATCGGFQHTILEIARDLLGIEGADHEEYAPNGTDLIIIKMACSLKGKTGEVLVEPNTLAHRLYPAASVEEDFLCTFGVNPAFKARFAHSLLKISGKDAADEIRIIEIPDHRFFMATLFVPQLRSSKESPHPIIEGFVKAVCGPSREL